MFRREFELLGLKDEESIYEYFSRTLAIASKMKANGEKLEETDIVEKIHCSLTPRFNYVACSIEAANDVTTLSIDELQSDLLVQEQRMKGQKEEEHALKVTSQGRFRGRGRGSSRGGRGRGRHAPNKENIEC